MNRNHPPFILVLRHEPFEHLGHFAEALPYPFRYHERGQPFENEPHDALIVMGGPQSANDPEMAPELAVIAEALQRGIPILGVCLGSQLIAKALGARVYRNAALEIGWAPVHLTESGRADAVLGGLQSPSMMFHWHGETFDLPRGAEWLAWSEKTPHQAYRFGTNVYGLQFHPEITAEMIEDWSAQPVNCGDAATLDHPIDARAHDLRAAAHGMMRRWLMTGGF